MNHEAKKNTKGIEGHIVLVILFALCLVFLSSCTFDAYVDYDGKWIMGKTASEIEEKYGPFDIREEREDDIERNYIRAGYKTRKERTGFLGTYPEEYYMIYFDKEGKAYYINATWYLPGG